MTDAALIGPVPAPGLHVMTYNIRRPMPHVSKRSPDRWERRRPLLGALLAMERPSVLGVQEALPEQASFVRHALGDDYRSVGYGRRPDRTGEGCPLYYDARRLELIDWAQTALSDTPELQGSSTWGNMVPRVLVRATFRDRETGAEFLAVNTHLDHLSRRSRIRSAQAIRALVAGQSLPAVVTGDFNTGEGSRPMRELLADEVLEDAWSAASVRLTAEWGTFPNYRDQRYDRKRIDWIATSPSIEVVRAGINVHRIDGGWPSDHAPVQVVLRMPPA